MQATAGEWNASYRWWVKCKLPLVSEMQATAGEWNASYRWWMKCKLPLVSEMQATAGEWNEGEIDLSALINISLAIWPYKMIWKEKTRKERYTVKAYGAREVRLLIIPTERINQLHYPAVCTLRERGRYDGPQNFWSTNLKVRDHLEELGVDGTILKFILPEYCVECIHLAQDSDR
jgi:hypothetical protein